MSLIEQHLSRIFALNFDHVRALEYSDKALVAAEKAGELLMADYCRLDRVKQLLAEYRYEEAEKILTSMRQNNRDNPVLYSYISKLLSQVFLFKDSHSFRYADECYKEICALNAIPLTAEDYGMLALIKENEGHSSVANTYLELARGEMCSKIDSLVFYNDCYNVYDKRGDWENALSSIVNRSKLQDEIVMGLLGQSITHAMENYYLESYEIERLRTKSRLFSFVLIGTVLLVLIIWLLFLLRKKNQQLLEDMIKIQEVSDDLNCLRAGGDVSFRIVDQLIYDKIKSLQQLSESFFSWEDAAVKKREQKNGKLFKEELIDSFRVQLGELRNDHSFISSLEHSLNLTNDRIMEKARQYLKNGKELDFSVLTMLFSGFSIKSISYLLRMSEASLRMRKTRFKQQFELASDPLRSLFIGKLN